jgi:hypothetical protein
VQGSRKRGRGASDSVAFVPSSLQTALGSLFFSSATEQRVVLGASGELTGGAGAK